MTRFIDDVAECYWSQADCDEDGYWWCERCQEEVDDENVTLGDLHDSCGTECEWVDYDLND